MKEKEVTNIQIYPEDLFNNELKLQIEKIQLLGCDFRAEKSTDNLWVIDVFNGEDLLSSFLYGSKSEWKNDKRVLSGKSLYNDFYVDLPSIEALYDPGSSWIIVDAFKTKAAAIAFAQKHFGADKKGRVSLISKVSN